MNIGYTPIKGRLNTVKPVIEGAIQSVPTVIRNETAIGAANATITSSP